MKLTAILTPAEEGGYVAMNPETGTTTQGEAVEEAIATFRRLLLSIRLNSQLMCRETRW